MARGVVENVNVDPPFDVTRPVVVALADVEVEKSVGNPTVVALGALFDVMVHRMGLPARGGVPATHFRTDAEFGIAIAHVGPRNPAQQPLEARNSPPGPGHSYSTM